MALVSHGLRRGSDPNPLKRITRQYRIDTKLTQTEPGKDGFLFPGGETAWNSVD